MKKCVLMVATVTGLVWVAVRLMPDLKRYLRIRSM
jgi:hypothetical protein